MPWLCNPLSLFSWGIWIRVFPTWLKTSRSWGWVFRLVKSSGLITSFLKGKKEVLVWVWGEAPDILLFLERSKNTTNTLSHYFISISYIHAQADVLYCLHSYDFFIAMPEPTVFCFKWDETVQIYVCVCVCVLCRYNQGTWAFGSSCLLSS